MSPAGKPAVGTACISGLGRLLGGRLLSGWLLAGCLTAACAPTPTPIDDPDPGLPPTPTFNATQAAFAGNVNPLTGLPSEDPAVAGRRPGVFAVAFGPSTEPMPTGVQESELVFESRLGDAPGADAASAEGHLTVVRLEAADPPPPLGPLGPATWLDVAVARSFGGTLTARSADSAIRAELAAADTPLLELSGGRGALPSPAPGPGPVAAGWAFDDAPAPGAGEAAGSLVWRDAGGQHLVLSDPILGTWRRWRAARVFTTTVGPASEATAMVDAGTGESLAFANVVFLEVGPRSDRGDPEWTGAGEALLLRDGRAITARWSRPGPGDALELSAPDGTPVALRRGSTWFLLVPAGTPLDVYP